MDRFGYELIFGGGAFYSLEDALGMMQEATGRLCDRPSGSVSASITCFLGSFDLRPVHSTWVDELMLGATDFYNARPVPAVQLVPDEDHHTINTPDMSGPFFPEAAPAWRWLREPWPNAIPVDSVAMTNLAALRGEAITEAARWEETDWELFAGPGPDVCRADARAFAWAPCWASIRRWNR